MSKSSRKSQKSQSESNPRMNEAEFWSQPASLKSQLTYAELARTDLARVGDKSIKLDSIPKDKWEKYDGNPNWVLHPKGEIQMMFDGIHKGTYVMLDFCLHSARNPDKILRRDDYMVPMLVMSPEEVERTNARILNARKMVAEGRGDELEPETDNQ